MVKKYTLMLAATLAAASFILPGSVHADWVASKPIRMIVPYAPGGSGDITGRTIADAIGKSLGQPIVIDNQPAASGVVGTEAGARAAGDGHTWTIANDAPFVILPHLRKLKFDPLKDFEPIALIATIPMVLVARSSLPIGSLRELITYAKANPLKLTYASSGLGATSHMAAELFMHEAGIKMLHVPYKGQAQGVTDVIGGQVDMIFSTFGPVLPYIQSGRLKALAVTTAKRSPGLPDVPTVSEVAAPGFDYAVWLGLVVPASTPKLARDQIQDAVAKAMQAPEVRAKFDSLGYVAGDGTPDEFRRRMVADHARWGRVIKEADIQMN